MSRDAIMTIAMNTSMVVGNAMMAMAAAMVGIAMGAATGINR